MLPANEAPNLIMVIIIKNGFQVDVKIGRYLRKMDSHTAPDGPKARVDRVSAPFAQSNKKWKKCFECFLGSVGLLVHPEMRFFFAK